MRLIKHKAISECKKLWDEIEESGLCKRDFLMSATGKEWLDKEYKTDCPLCEYSRYNGCGVCPLWKDKQGCMDLGFSAGYTCSEMPRFIQAVKELK